MKRLSIKARVTIWYVCFLVIIVSLLFAASIYMSNQLVQKDLKGDLAAMVLDSAKDVNTKGDTLEIDDDLTSYRDGIYILIYKENNFLVTGLLPEGVDEEIPFISGQVKKVQQGEKEYYVYDYGVGNEKVGDVWIRGITSAALTETDPAATLMIRYFLILLPFLILLAAAGGYQITKRAFRPVTQIWQTAHDIGSGRDLSRRISFDEKAQAKDEIYNLVMAFDKMLDRLEASFESEKQFSSNASHELRTPISVILAECEDALDNARTLKEAQTALEAILSQTKKMSGLMAQLLTLARADRGVDMLELETINVSELLEMVLQEQEASAVERKIGMQRDIEPDVFAKVDQTMIMRLFMNLVSNAIKFGREDGFVKVNLHKENHRIVAQIMDNGIGISEEALPKLWDRFYQVSAARSSEGLGLGLSMAKWIAEAHGGTIHVNSTLGKGTTFTVTLPIQEV